MYLQFTVSHHMNKISGKNVKQPKFHQKVEDSFAQLQLFKSRVKFQKSQCIEKVSASHPSFRKKSEKNEEKKKKNKKIPKQSRSAQSAD